MIYEHEKPMTATELSELYHAGKAGVVESRIGINRRRYIYKGMIYDFEWNSPQKTINWPGGWMPGEPHNTDGSEVTIPLDMRHF